MESYRMTGLPLMSFQQHLSRLYNDTKKSSDFVKEPVQNAEDPEIKALHRKLRIQKDRLVSWGLEWSDPSQSSEVLIDSSISRAGLSEIVSSIMSTIKETLAEVEPLWLSSKRLVGEDTPSLDRDRDRKLSSVTWDKARFVDLVRDLTVSIDTLYDLSRNRLSESGEGGKGGGRGGPSKPTPSWLERGPPAEDLRPFESTRMQVPQQINSATLTCIESPHLADSPPGTETRQVVFMSKQVYADFARVRGLRQGYSPLLLEYSYFDPVYSSTGIMPSMARFEKLASGLQANMQRPSNAWIGIPQLLGYFEDMDHSRLGLVYHFPPGCNAVVPSDVAAHQPRSCLLTLSDMLSSPSVEPRLEAKFRLASNLANTVFEMHARGIAHGRLGDQSVLFGRDAAPGTAATDISRADVRKPLISGFDLFPSTPSPDREQQSLLFRHPLNPQSFSPESPPIVDADPRAFDLYSVAMLLLSIGMWTKVENLVPHRESASVSETVLDQLAVQCGTLYMKAVQTCWNAMETVVSAKTPSESHLARVELKVSRYLEACCVLDTVSAFEEPTREGLRREDTFGATTITATPAPTPTLTPAASFYQKQSTDVKSPLDRGLDRGRPTDDFPMRAAPVDARPPIPPRVPAARTTTFGKSEAGLSMSSKPEPVRLKLFPQVALPPDVIEQWHTFLMPQINFALRNFYRNHPESVEISLESVGESPRNTKPTVMVVCTSVSKVRHILKRKLGAVFDGSSGFSLKVCSGRVLRSRKDGAAQGARPKRNQDDGGRKQILAANNQFQERPQNGASIGAWIGDRHLPPVSFGGLVLVDGKPFGMTVHHMLDDPDAIEAAAAREGQKTVRSSSSAAATQEIEALGQSLLDWYEELQADSSTASSNGGDFACEFSDTNSAVSDSDLTSEWSDNSDEEENDESGASSGEPGDLPGVEPGFGDGYVVTQPALDDVEKDFYPDQETQDDDHLDSCGLGDIFASSGVRRRVDEQGLVHEIDWALFEFKEERRPADNSIPHLPLERRGSPSFTASAAVKPSVLHPTTVAPSSALPGLEVQCIARTSGLQTGQILPTITSVKIYGRLSPSHTYQISGSSSAAAATAAMASRAAGRRPNMPIGIPGDSGAWIVEREHGRLCGHVLAWSERKKVAYLCPMDVMLLDIAETLEAGEVRLPGGDAVVKIMDGEARKKKEAWRGLGKGTEPDGEEGDLGKDKGEEEEDEGYHDEHNAAESGAGTSFGPTVEKFEGGDMCPQPTKMMELAGSLGKMHLGGGNVETAC
ncbi:het-s domain containing protein [Grosmannia clavigera kw1407]|uniref:Het-s domain containing protein n=1 Tax=Grosmannia clavigera (strain kw1407 / UAMH 11150) TaxID=655863 RepID=F0XIB3_GROCL|nr:het-s domain containing protein [Grosmannia clavigera kw1407]EFX03326.1 het-s domain containing protein [Grosmannia clavigera kw1407]